MSKILKVSISGYYDWLKDAMLWSKRAERKGAARADQTGI